MNMISSISFSNLRPLNTKCRSCPPQARKRGLDKGEVRREEVPEEAGLHRDTRQRGEEVRAAVERQEVSETQQCHHRTQNTAEIPAGRWKHLPVRPLLRYFDQCHSKMSCLSKYFIGSYRTCTENSVLLTVPLSRLCLCHSCC